MGVTRPKYVLTLSNASLYPQMGKMQKAASAAHTFFVANPSHLEMRNNIEKYRRMEEVSDDAFVDREKELETHWVSKMDPMADIRWMIVFGYIEW